MRVLVTGGNGFIGTNFILHTQNYFEKIINLDCLTYAANKTGLEVLQDNPNYIFINDTILNKNRSLEICERFRVEAIINFAAETHVDNSIINADKFVETNINGTYNLLSAAHEYWKKLPLDEAKRFRFIQISTDEVFGSLKEGDLASSETTRFAPNNPYSATKAASDHLCRAFYVTHNFPIIVTNCSNNYGPYQDAEKLVPKIISNAFNYLPIPIYGNGSQIRDWLYVEDHCEAILRVLKKGKVGETYNVGGIGQIKNIDLAHMICSMLDKLKPIANGSYRDLISFVADRPGHDQRYDINSSKISNQLNWSPCFDLSTGIEKTIQWHLSQVQNKIQ